MLAQHRRNGEWFSVAPDDAVGAISAAAFRRGQQLLSVTPGRAEQIRQIAAQLPNKKPSTVFSRVAVGLLQLVAGFIIAGAVLAFIAIRFGRML